jgi:hypothetical protein
MLAARVCAYSLTAKSAHPEKFEVRMLRFEETPHLCRGREGKRYLWDGRVCIWQNRDLQAFAPLRMMAPQTMDYRGRALVLDPDIFAVGDVADLLARDMGEKAILCRPRSAGFFKSSVMLLDCARLKHWRWNDDLDSIFAMRLDLYRWLGLTGEDPERIGIIEDEWNHMDTLDGSTKLLHNSERLTQPWKTGLPVDFDLNEIGSYPYRRGFHLRDLVYHYKLRIFPPEAPVRHYQQHPDRRQELYFLELLRAAIDDHAIAEEFVSEEIRRGHVRPDLLQMVRCFRSTRVSGEVV